MYKHCSSKFHVAKLTDNIESGEKELVSQCSNQTGLATAMWESLPPPPVSHGDKSH